MCGRFPLTLEPEEVVAQCQSELGAAVEWVSKQDGPQFSPSPNIPPSSCSPVLLQAGQGQLCLRPQLWGLPAPAPTPGRPALLPNCRQETAATSPLFSPLLAAGRCVVVCEGWYEWEGGRGGPPWLVSRPRPALLTYMAALSNGSHFTILTRAAEPGLSWLHHRQPALLCPDQVAAWLDPARPPALPGPGPALAWHRVSRAVGSVACQQPGLTRPVEDPAPSPAFLVNWLKRGSQQSSGPTKKRREDVKLKDSIEAGSSEKQPCRISRETDLSDLDKLSKEEERLSVLLAEQLQEQEDLAARVRSEQVQKDETLAWKLWKETNSYKQKTPSREKDGKQLTVLEMFRSHNKQ